MLSFENVLAIEPRLSLSARLLVKMYRAQFPCCLLIVSRECNLSRVGGDEVGRRTRRKVVQGDLDGERAIAYELEVTGRTGNLVYEAPILRGRSSEVTSRAGMM